MEKSVRGPVAFGLALTLAFGVATGWLASGDDKGGEIVTQKSWLFSQTADAGEIRERADGSLELVLRSIDEWVMAFTDRPFRDVKIERLGRFVSFWDELFGDSPPNAVLVEHEPDGVARSVAMELSSPRLMSDELTYTVTVLTAIPEGSLALVAGVAHETPIRSFRAVSLFIDDVTSSCEQGGGSAIGKTGEGGGVVFSIDGSGKYLEAASADLPNALTWKDAIKQAKSYRGGGKSDWYLPNSDELYALYKQRSAVGGFSNSNYWSSSVWDSLSAYTTYFGNGDQYGSYTTLSMQVRPIRAGYFFILCD